MLHETEYTLINQLLSINYIPTTIFFVYQRYDFESKTQFVNRFLGDPDLYDWKNVNRYKAFVEQRSYDRWSSLRFKADCQSFNLTASDFRCNARSEFSIFLSPFYVLALLAVHRCKPAPTLWTAAIRFGRLPSYWPQSRKKLLYTQQFSGLHPSQQTSKND